MLKLIGATRYLIIIPVLGCFVLSAALLVYGAVEVVHVVEHLFGPDKLKEKALVVAAIELVDLFLLGTVFFIIALGLCELFISDKVPLPEWLEIHSLDDLKNKLASVVAVVLAVMFLGNVITWDGQSNLLYLGAPIAMVIAALTYFLGLKKQDKAG